MAYPDSGHGSLFPKFHGVNLHATGESLSRFQLHRSLRIEWCCYGRFPHHAQSETDMPRIAIFDDYQNVALELADWVASHGTRNSNGL